jgi:hypothetical protein
LFFTTKKRTIQFVLSHYFDSNADHELVHGRSWEQIPEWQQKADYITSLCKTQIFAGLEGEAVETIQVMAIAHLTLRVR